MSIKHKYCKKVFYKTLLLIAISTISLKLLDLTIGALRNKSNFEIVGEHELLVEEQGEVQLSLVLRRWPKDHKSIRRPSDEYLAKTDSLSKSDYRIETDNFGFIKTGNKGLASPDGEDPVTIMCLGGSTTECLFVEEARRWPSVLEREAATLLGENVKVLNCGNSGNNTMHSFFNLASDGFKQKIDYAIILHAVNDLSHLLYQDILLGKNKNPQYYHNNILIFG